MRYGTILMMLLFFMSCDNAEQKKTEIAEDTNDISLAILGIAQDAGYPQAGCLKDCCKPFREGEEKARSAASIAIIDRTTKQTWLFEATPDVKHQLYQLQELSGFDAIVPNGVFLTHAHIGHYTGLIHFGHEVMGAKKLPVFAMPKMSNYLTNNELINRHVGVPSPPLRRLRRAADTRRLQGGAGARWRRTNFGRSRTISPRRKEREGPACLCSLNVLPARRQILGSPRLFIDMIASTGSRQSATTLSRTPASSQRYCRSARRG